MPWRRNGRLNAATEPAVRVFDEHKERPRLRGWLLAARLALLAVIASYPIVSRYVGGLKSAEHLPPSSPTAVAVLPFSVSGGKDLGYLSEGMVTLLSTKLDGAAELRQVDPHSLLSFVKREGGWTPDPERGQQVAEHFGAGLYVLGSILDVSGRLHIEASIYDARKAADVAHATVEELRRSRPRSRRRSRGRAPRRAPDRPWGSYRAHERDDHAFLSRLKAFLEGETAFRAGRATEAIEAYRRAIAADEGFALAHYSLARAAGWTSQADLTRSAAADALRLKDRLSEHDRELVEAWAAAGNGAIAGDAAALPRDSGRLSRRLGSLVLARRVQRSRKPILWSIGRRSSPRARAQSLARLRAHRAADLRLPARRGGGAVGRISPAPSSAISL